MRKYVPKKKSKTNPETTIFDPVVPTSGRFDQLMNAARQRMAIKYAERGYNITQIAESLSVSKQVVSDFMIKNQEFGDAVKMAQGMLRRAAKDNIHYAVTKTRCIGTSRWLLERTDEDYKQKTETTHRGVVVMHPADIVKPENSGLSEGAIEE